MTPDLLLTKKWAGTQNAPCVPLDSEDGTQRDKVERASIKCILGFLAHSWRLLKKLSKYHFLISYCFGGQIIFIPLNPGPGQWSKFKGMIRVVNMQDCTSRMQGHRGAWQLLLQFILHHLPLRIFLLFLLLLDSYKWGTSNWVSENKIK